MLLSEAPEWKHYCMASMKVFIMGPWGLRDLNGVVGYLKTKFGHDYRLSLI